ncbi:MAG TPA: HAMP domain-containing protein [Caldithrix abyssi]|uniref:histidine kinase n=1 Tax=Caldithrix abyssi TaxID=187145 RepID=A0A7V4WWJ9_CALAY|nr:HAMP domain-containing protein [Caldithrix abyssi]
MLRFGVNSPNYRAKSALNRKTMPKLSTKIEIGYLFFAAIIVAVAVFSIYHIRQLSHPLYLLLRGRYENVTAAEKMLSNIRQQESEQFNMVEQGLDTASVRRFKKAGKEFVYWHNQARNSISLPEEPVLLDSIAELYSVYQEKSNVLQHRLEAGIGYKERKAFHSRQIVPVVMKLSNLCHELQEINEIAIERTERRAEKLSSQATGFIVLFVIAALVFSMAAGWYFTKRIIRPLKDATEKVKKIGQGNWDQKLEIKTNDELEELAYEFNRMTARLAEYEKLNVKKLLAEKKKAETIVSNIPVGILVLDEEDHITLLNTVAEQVLQKDRNEILYHSIQKMNLSVEMRNVLLSEVQSAKNIDSERLPLIPVETGNHTRFYTVRRIPLATQIREKAGTIVLFQDVTTYQELDDLRSEFIATISHEIKTPITSLNMAVDILLKEVKGPLTNNQKELLNDARNDVVRLKTFVKELLDLAKLESGHYPLEYKRIDVAALIRRSWQSLLRLAEEKNVSIQTKIEKNLPPLYGDERLLNRALTNLLKNALEHSPYGEQISIRVSVESSRSMWVISDRGKGIPPQARELIFDKFVRLNKSGDSVGLGLSITREIIRRHGGRIWAEDNADRGARLCFSLPLGSAHKNNKNSNGNKKNENIAL